MSEHPYPGQRIGRWTVGQDYRLTPKGERQYLCRCSCGTERYVLERSLRYNRSLSCGCLRQERARKAVALELAGKRFGDLTAIAPSAKRNGSRGISWHCQCDCGNTCEVMGSLLAGGRKTHCGCKTIRNQPIADIAGRVFGRLTALYPTARRSVNGSVLWRCRCSCGTELDVSYNELMYTNVKSCGCQKKEHDQALKDLLTHIDGTSLEMIGSAKLPANNTTGYRGVYLCRGKYMAKIVFQQKAYYLGAYTDIRDAAQARREAEEAIFQTALPFYAAWLKKAEQDPRWAEEHPVSVRVRRDGKGRLYLDMLPDLVMA